jgi:uncharacterized protein YndB with AHSA1/START domain
MNETKTPGTDLLVARVFDAPRERVWNAWTEPEAMKRWWGPRFYTAPTIKNDLRKGGSYLYCMRSPEGKDFWSSGTYREVVPNERIEALDGFADPDGKRVPGTFYGMDPTFPLESPVSTTFTDIGGKTLVTVRQPGLPAGRTSEFAVAGWGESFDKLAALLAAAEHQAVVAGMTFTVEPGKQEVSYVRMFNAPRERVFAAYLDAKLIPDWWGPKYLTTKIDKHEARPGGTWRYIQRSPDGKEFAFNGVYHTVKAPELLIATFEFEPMPGHVSLDTAVFEDVGGKTRFSGKTVFMSVEDRDGMVGTGMKEGMAEGMTRLAEIVEKPAGDGR